MFANFVSLGNYIFILYSKLIIISRVFLAKAYLIFKFLCNRQTKSAARHADLFTRLTVGTPVFPDKSVLICSMA